MKTVPENETLLSNPPLQTGRICVVWIILLGLLNHPKFVVPDYYLHGGEDCGQRGLGGEYDCVVNNSDTVTIPCGSFFPQERVTFTYYVRENQSILAVELGRYLQWNVSRTDSGIHICCKPNISIGQFDPCYRLNVTCECCIGWCSSSVAVYSSRWIPLTVYLTHLIWDMALHQGILCSRHWILLHGSTLQTNIILRVTTILHRQFHSHAVSTFL